MERREYNKHPSHKQKKKLLELITKYPHLITGKVTQDFSYMDFQKMWQLIAKECNAVPGTKKTWRQWRKTWQDLRSKTKKQQLRGTLPPSLNSFTPAEQEALGVTNVTSSLNCQETSTEFVPLETQNTEENNFHTEIEDAPSLSEPESPREEKVFTQSYSISPKRKNSASEHSVSCIVNYDLLAVNEQKKLQLKEDFINYKKGYLRKKLKLMKEQTEALKTIARELSEK